MPVITLLSDYGLTDYRVAAIKGKIFTENEGAKIVDISHEIIPYDLQQGSYILKNAYTYFPKGSIHLVCIDSFHHKDRKYIIYKADGHFFIAADNGFLSLVFQDIKPESVFEITVNTRFDDVVQFPATDIFVPAALHLINGGLPEVIGRKYKTPKQITMAKPGHTEQLIFGEVIYIDNFGNAVTNISKRFFDEHSKSYNNFVIKFRSLSFTKIHHTYTEIVTDWSKEKDYHGKAAAVFNDHDMLELTVYKGSINNGAKSLLGLKIGEKIYIELQK